MPNTLNTQTQKIFPKSMKSFLLFLYCTLHFCNFINGKSYNVLILGNSYVYYNNMPNILQEIAWSNGDSLNITSNSPGAYTFNAHTTNATSIALIQQGNWDFVILQGQSQEPSFSPGQVANNTLPYAKKLDSLVAAYNNCAEVLYYMTWGRKNGDASNCAVYPPICTYNGMQQRLRETYLLMAQDNASNVAPVGVVWKRVREVDSSINLYDADESHPSLAGSYLAACTFYTSMFHKALNSSHYISPGVSGAQASIIHAASNFIVLDSIENWQQYGGIPNANFSISGTNNITFTNLSKRNTTSFWDFGNGNTSNSNASTVTQNYLSTGAYNAILKVENACGKSDTAFIKINVSSGTGIPIWQASNSNIIVNHQTLEIYNNVFADELKIFSLQGQVIAQYNLVNGAQKINIETFSKGIFIYQILKGKSVIKSGKLHL
jgi:hypothetical protein